MEKPYSMVLSEKMTPNSQRGADGAVAESKEPQNMGSNTVYYGVTLGKLLNVCLGFLICKKMVMLVALTM